MALLRLLPALTLAFFAALFALALLSRLGVLTLFGGVVVFSSSMEPSLRRWDMVLFAGLEPSPGDVVVYCLTPSFCVVHRYVADCPAPNDCIVTRGDANPAPDPYLVSRRMVRGVVLWAVPREVWIPLFAYALAIAVAEAARARLVGLPSAMVYTTIVLFMLVVYGFTQPTPEVAQPELPALYLSRLELDTSTCTLSISYSGVLQLTDVEVLVNGRSVPASFNSTHVVVPLPREVAMEIGGSGPAEVRVVAALNRVGRLAGSYTVRAYPKQLSATSVDGKLVISNPNCFPLSVNVTFRYAYGAGEPWRHSSVHVLVEGGGVVLLEPPEGSRYAVADVRYVLAGAEVWRQLVVRYQ